MPFYEINDSTDNTNVLYLIFKADKFFEYYVINDPFQLKIIMINFNGAVVC